MKLLSTSTRFRSEKFFLISAYLVAIFSFLKNILLKKIIDPEIFVDHLLALNLLAYVRYVHLGVPTIPSYEKISLIEFKSSLVSSSIIIGLPIFLLINFYLIILKDISWSLTLACGLFIISQIFLNILTQKKKIWESYNKTGKLNLLNILNITSLIVSVVLDSFIPSVLIFVILFNKHLKLSRKIVSLKFLKRNGLKYVLVGIVNQLLFTSVYFGLDYNFDTNTTGDLFIIISIYNFTIILSNSFNEFVILRRSSLKISLTNHLLIVIISGLLLMCLGIFIAQLLDIISLTQLLNHFPTLDIILLSLFLIIWIVKNPIIDKALLRKNTSKFYLTSTLITSMILILTNLEFRSLIITTIAILTINLTYLNHENNRRITT